MDNKQIELDSFENTILQTLFGPDWRNSKGFKVIEFMKPGLVQGYINKFEEVVLPFMNDDGSVNGMMLKRALEFKSQTLAEIVPNKNFLLNEILKDVTKIYRGD